MHHPRWNGVIQPRHVLLGKQICLFPLYLYLSFVQIANVILVSPIQIFFPQAHGSLPVPASMCITTGSSALKSINILNSGELHSKCGSALSAVFSPSDAPADSFPWITSRRDCGSKNSLIWQSRYYSL